MFAAQCTNVFVTKGNAFFNNFINLLKCRTVFEKKYLFIKSMQTSIPGSNDLQADPDPAFKNIRIWLLQIT
jgi:hypothetical protein